MYCKARGDYLFSTLDKISMHKFFNKTTALKSFCHLQKVHSCSQHLKCAGWEAIIDETAYLAELNLPWTEEYGWTLKEGPYIPTTMTMPTWPQDTEKGTSFGCKIVSFCSKSCARGQQRASCYTLDASVRVLLPDTSVRVLLPDTSVRVLLPDTSVRVLLPDTSVRVLLPDTSVRVLLPDTSVRILLPDTSVRVLLPDTSVRALLPDTSVRVLLPDTSVRVLLPDTSVRVLLPDTSVRVLLPDTSVRILLEWSWPWSWQLKKEQLHPDEGDGKGLVFLTRN